MSYATLLDALFALDLTDSELRDSTSTRRQATRDTGGRSQACTPRASPTAAASGTSGDRLVEQGRPA